MLLIGSLAGAFQWLVIYPFDLIKARIQTESFSLPTQRMIRKHVANVISEQGLAGFYRGFTPCLVRSVPTFAAAFLTFEATKKRLQGCATHQDIHSDL